jgi:phage shock protein PspC (stress-responsive transcriptional regulator)
MDDESPRPCPYCAEPISPAAVRCPHCRSHLSLRDPRGWHRSQPGRKIAGVCAAVAHGLAVPVTPVRLAFVVLTLFHLTGIIAYVALWLIIPEQPGQEPALIRAVSWISDTFRRLFGNQPRGGGGSTDVGPVP